MTPILALFSSADWIGESDQEYANYGWSVDAAGDVNGDGYADVIVGASGYDNGESGEGRAYVYYGSSTGLAATPAWTTEPDALYASLGSGVSSAGDVNGDGNQDVMVGAAQWDDGEPPLDAGRVEIFHGSALGLETIAATALVGTTVSASFGSSVDAGDVNGDGFGDVVVGAPNGTVDNPGEAFVYHGSAAGLVTFPAWTGEADNNGATDADYGSCVRVAGDVDGDGFDDVLVGAPAYDKGQTDEGRAYLYLGSSVGLESAAAWEFDSDQKGASLGFALSSAGDVNADDFDDVIVAAPYFGSGQANEGRIWLFLGSSTGLSTVPAWSEDSNQVSATLGQSVASAGDIDNDGYDDVVVGAPLWSSAVGDVGAAFVYRGTAAGLEADPAFTVESDQVTSYFGYSVAGAGDIDADGYDDVVVGARNYANGQSYEGRAYVYLSACADPIDSDGDGVGDRCDLCPGSDDLVDGDVDGLPDDCDPCPAFYDPTNSPDADSDGFCAAQDCDDNDPTIHPGALELCDGVDNACSGTVPTDEIDADGDGERTCAGDCDDGNPDLFSGQTESCNGLDDNCDGEPSPDEIDDDGDHFAECDGDCNDDDDRQSPALSDICRDGLDNDCDGAIDPSCATDVEEDPGCTCNGAGGAGGRASLLALVLLLERVRRRPLTRRAAANV